jgi:hypothetical protein
MADGGQVWSCTVMAPIACVLCAVDPNMAGLVVPLAQATMVATPILLRKQLARGFRRVTRRREPMATNAPPRQSRLAPDTEQGQNQVHRRG